MTENRKGHDRKVDDNDDDDDEKRWGHFSDPSPVYELEDDKASYTSQLTPHFQPLVQSFSNPTLYK